MAFSRKKFAKEIDASEFQLSHVFKEILTSVYYIPCSLQGSGIERATEIDMISHSFPCSCLIIFLDTQ